MSTLTKPTQRSPKSGKYRPMTVGSVEKESGFVSDIADKNMRIATYFRNEGYISLAQVLEKVERNLVKRNVAK